MAHLAKSRISTIAFLAVQTAVALPAFADVTPEDVWQNWQDISAAQGQAVVAASAARDGDTLVVSGMTIASAGGGVTVEGALDEVRMQDLGDGTVRVTLSPDYPVKLRLPPAEAGKPDVEMNILVSQTDLSLVASGDPEAMSYLMDAPLVKIKLDRIDGTDGDKIGLTVDATFTDMAGTYSTKKDGAGWVLDSDITLPGLALAIIGSDPAKQGELRATVSMAGLAMTTSGALLGALGSAAITPEMLASMTSATTLTTASSEFDIETVDPSGTTTLKGTAGPGSMKANIAGGLMDYATAQQGLSLVMNMPSVPMPDLSVTIADVSFAMKAPIAPSETAQPFAFSTKLVDLALSEQIWAMFDPSAQLPRDPINLVIDAEGSAKPNAAPKAGLATGGLPADLENLNLKELRLSVAGAELTGAGTSTFEAVEGGLPQPNAKLDFTLTGANGLMDKLVAAGLLTPDMLTMPRMMLAMVASPAAGGVDSYTSVIEVKNKQISANGQVLHQME